MATGELYYEVSGEGQPVVLLHPGFADSRIWDPPELRARIAEMQRDAFINTRDLATTWREETLVSGLADRLAEIAVPTLVVVGQLDMSFIHDQAQPFADRIRGARLTILPNSAHAPSIERPEDFDCLVIPFLQDPLASSPPDMRGARPSDSGA